MKKVIDTVFGKLSWVDLVQLLHMAKGFFGEVEAGPAATGTVPEGGATDASFKDWGDERIILPLLMKLPTPDRVLITDLLSDLSSYERNGFRQVLSGVSSGRTILIRTVKKGSKGQPEETREEKKEPDFTDEDLRVQVLREIAAMIRDPKVGKEGTLDFLRIIGTLPGRSQWEQLQDKMLELYRSGALDMDMRRINSKLRAYCYILTWIISALLLLVLFGLVFSGGFRIWGTVFVLFSVLLVISYRRKR